jgi:hypothetical protein
VVTKRKLVLKAFQGRPLRRGTVVEIRVERAGRTGAVKRLTVNGGAKAPSLTTRCLPAGARRPVRC